MRKKLLSVLLALVMVLGLVPVTALAAETDQFTDLDPEGWYYDDVKFAVENGYMNGVGDGTRFDPTGTLTRAMFVTVLGRYGKAETDATRTSFTDVPIGEWYTGYVTWASDNRIVEGDGTGRFNPEGNITNQEMATIIDRFVTWYGNAFNKEHVIKGEAKTFIDQVSIPSWAIDHVTQAQIYGLMHGDQNGAFNPLATSQRAQAAALLHRLEWKDKTTVQPDKPDKPDKPDNPTPPAPGGGGIGGGGSKSYTVTFDLNYAGATGAPDSQTVKRNAAVKFPADPTREGHTFKGWTTTKEDKEPYYNSESTDYKVKSDVTFYAQWEVNSYTVTFNANSGAPAPQSQTVKFGGKITEPGEMTKADHIFDGWYTDPELTEKVDFDTFTMPAKDITLYAKWNIEQVTVTVYLNKDDPAETPATTTLDKGGKFTVPEAPTWDKHRFLGWSDTKEGPADTTKYPAGQEITVDADLTLYAQWIEQVTVTVYLNKDDPAETPATTTLDKGGKFTVPEAPTWDKHRFLGWADTKEGPADTAKYPAGQEITVDADLTLYAQWIEQVTVTIHYNSTQTDPAPTVLDKGGEFTIPTPDAYDAHEFAGWATTQGGEPDDTYKSGETVTVDANLDLYAVWKNVYTIKFFSDDTQVGAFTVTEGGTYTVPQDPTKDGFVFKGWAAVKGGTQAAQGITAGAVITPTASAEYYAIWVAEFTVTIKYQDGTTADKTEKVEDGQKFTVPSDEPTRDGYRFMGYSTTSAGPAEDQYKPGTVLTITADLTLYAIWEEEFTITFNLNYDGAQEPYTTIGNKIKGEKVDIPEPPTRTGYEFLGWAETTDGDVTIKPDSKDQIEVTGDKTYYAKWIQLFTVTLKPGFTDGTAADVTKEVRSGSEFEFTEEIDKTFTRDGYVFLGWKLDNDGDTLYKHDDATNNKYTVTANVSFTAQWGVEYTVILKNGEAVVDTEKIIITTEKGTAEFTFEEENEPTGDYGYIFLGWNKDNNSFTAEKHTGDKLTIPTDITDPSKTATYYAVWAFDYLKDAVEGSVETFNSGLGTDIKNAVATLVEELNKWIDESGYGPKIETDVADSLEITVGELKGETIDVTVKVDTNSPTMLALGEFAIRYGVAVAGPDKSLEDLKDELRAIVMAVLNDLGIQDPVSLRDVEGLVSKLVGNYKQGYVDAFLNLNSKSSVNKVKVEFGSYSLEATAGAVTMDTAKEAAKALAKAVRDAAHTNGTFDNKIDGAVTIKADFTAADPIKAWYVDGASDLPEGLPFKHEYTVNLKFEVNSDYLDYKFADGQDYVKITLPEKVETAWEAKFPQLVDRLFGSAPVQAQLAELSKTIEDNIKNSAPYKKVGEKLDDICTSFDMDSSMSDDLGTQLHKWLVDNCLAPDPSNGNKIDLLHSFIVTKKESDNSALYNFVIDTSAEAKDKIKAAIEKQANELPDKNAITVVQRFQTGSGELDVRFDIPIDHNPRQLFMDAVMGTGQFSSKSDPSMFVKNLLEAVNIIEKDLEKLKADYLAPAPGKTFEAQYKKLHDLIDGVVKRDYNLFYSTWNSMKNLIYQYIVNSANEKYDETTQKISEAKKLLNKLDVESGDNAALINPILTYFYADVMGAFNSKGVSQDATTAMQTAIDSFTTTAIEARELDFAPYLQIIEALQTLGGFDDLWEAQLNSILGILENDQAQEIMKKALTDDVCSRINSGITKLEGYLDELPDSASITISGQKFSKVELKTLLSRIKTGVNGKNALIIIRAVGTFAGKLKDLSFSSFTESNKQLVTVSWNGHSADFYLILEHKCPKA